MTDYKVLSNGRCECQHLLFEGMVAVRVGSSCIAQHEDDSDAVQSDPTTTVGFRPFFLQSMLIIGLFTLMANIKLKMI